MKLEDLHEERIDDYVRRLVKTLNIQKLGSGAFSTVFQHPVYHNVSVKLTRDADPHYILWMRESEKRPNNPWFPKLIGIHKVQFHSGDLDKKFIDRDEGHDAALEGRHLVFMQKLRPMTKSEHKKTAQYLIGQMPDKLFMSQELRAAYRRAPWGGKRRRELDKEFKSNGGKFYITREDVDSVGDVERDMWEWLAKHATDKNLRELAEVLVRVGMDDLHDGNVMMRDDGGIVHPVITDPVAS